MEKENKISLILIIISLALIIASFFVGGSIGSFYVGDILAFAAFLVCGAPVVYSAIKSIFKGELLDETFLMTLASVCAIVIGEVREAAAVMTFYCLGELFSDLAVDRSREKVSSLAALRPDRANVLRDGTAISVAADEVEIGETIVVRSGEMIPLDGVIIDGQSDLDTSALTGESTPRDVFEGDRVLSGAINLTGLLYIKTDSKAGDSTVARILDLIENQENGKSKSEKFMTRFARVYTPAVVALALIVAVVPSLITREWSVWIHRALSFLVISCPCALVISVPLTFFCAIGAASKKGILIKGSNFIEALAKCDCAVFDKTGTLTDGTFTVNELIASDKSSESELLALAAALESYCDHPIAKAIANAGKDAGNPSASDFENIAGYGVAAKIGGERALAGNARLLEKEGIAFEASASDATAVFIALGDRYLGCITLADKIKDGAKDAIASLASLGISDTVMLTGDREEAAKRVADELGIGNFRASMLPADKAEAIAELKKSHGSVVFIGDGINDAPVIRASDVGIAMGALGSDAAIESSDVIITDDDIRKLPSAISLSRRTKRIVWENIIFALGAKIAIMILGVLGIGGLWLAVFADVGVSVIAVVNSLRAMR